MTAKKQIPFFLYKRNINKEKSNSSLRKYLVGLTLKMIWHSYLSTFFHINKKNIKTHLLELVISETRCGRFKSFSILLKLSNFAALPSSITKTNAMIVQLSGIKSFVFNKSMTSKVNFRYTIRIAEHHAASCQDGLG